MSSILDALRKLDEQKNVRKKRPVDIATGVVRIKSGPKHLPVRLWQVATACAAVAIVSIVGTLLLMRDKEPPQAVPVVTSPEPHVAAPRVVPSAPPKGAVTVPALPLANQRLTVPLSPPPRQVTPVPVARPALLPAHPPPLVVQPAAPVVASPTPVETTAPVPPPPAPAPRLTGIGWQKDASARFAVINGKPVSEGGSVDGARVEEIMPEKVRLRIDGRVVDIELGK